MEFFRKHKLIAATIAIQLVVLPIMLFMVKQEQDTQTQATPATTLFFNPSSGPNGNPIIKYINEALSLDLMVTPAGNLISLVKVEVKYDPTIFKLNTSNPVTINSQAFPVTVEGPVVNETTGTIQVVVSVGSDQTKVIQTSTKIMTINLIANSPTNQSQISVNMANSFARSIATQDTNTENVISSAMPAYVKINTAPTVPPPSPTKIPTPTAPPPSPTKIPTPTAPPPTKTPTPTLTVTPIPTNVPTPVSTLLYFTGFKLHGLGIGGDNPNPNSNGTLNILRPNRELTVEIYNTSGTLISTIKSGLAYDGPNNGTFDSLVSLPSNISTGNYIIKVQSPYYLKKQIPGFVNLITGQTNNMTSVALIAGDSNQDNRLSVADYNIIMDCYSDLGNPKNCDANKKLAADITDDGKVNQDDYNLFLRELSVQSGD